MKRVVDHLWRKLRDGLRTAPQAGWRGWVPIGAGYAGVALAVALGTGLVEPQLAEPRLWFILPLTLLVFPVFFEEAVFRGLLIPRQIRGLGMAAFHVVLSSALFVLWHPLNALTINPGARELFLRADFLGIVFLLGLACGAGYVISRSLWVPILIHWVTVVVWVLGLGGRNLILE